MQVAPISKPKLPLAAEAVHKQLAVLAAKKQFTVACPILQTPF
jgi:hypothetical protein